MPLPGVHDPGYVENLAAVSTAPQRHRRAQVELLREQIAMADFVLLNKTDLPEGGAELPAPIQAR